MVFFILPRGGERDDSKTYIAAAYSETWLAGCKAEPTSDLHVVGLVVESAMARKT